MTEIKTSPSEVPDETQVEPLYDPVPRTNPKEIPVEPKPKREKVPA